MMTTAAFDLLSRLNFCLLVASGPCADLARANDGAELVERDMATMDLTAADVRMLNAAIAQVDAKIDAALAARK